MPELRLEELAEFSDLFEEDAQRALSPKAIVAKRDQAGATSPRRVRAALRSARRDLEKLEKAGV